MGSFVNEPQESSGLLAWTFPIRKTGSNFAHMQLDTKVTLYNGTATNVRYGQLLLPTDYIRYSCFNKDCVCRGATHADPSMAHIAHVIAVGKDYQERFSRCERRDAAVLVYEALQHSDLRPSGQRSSHTPRRRLGASRFSVAPSLSSKNKMFVSRRILSSTL